MLHARHLDGDKTDNRRRPADLKWSPTPVHDGDTDRVVDVVDKQKVETLLAASKVYRLRSTNRTAHAAPYHCPAHGRHVTYSCSKYRFSYLPASQSVGGWPDRSQMRMCMRAPQPATVLVLRYVPSLLLAPVLLPLHRLGLCGACIAIS